DLIDDEAEGQKKEIYTNLISQEIYLDLQDDEIEFTNEVFRQVYFDVISQLNQEEDISVDAFINHVNTEISSLVTNILMDDEKHTLSDWKRKEIVVKGIDEGLSKLVSDSVFNLRRILIDEKIGELQKDVSMDKSNDSILEEIVNYSNLKKRLFNELNRVV
ncbi:MAG: DNA primase, partial [Urechidicola sp.]